MITNQKLSIDGKTVTLENTIDTSAAKELAHEMTQQGGTTNRNIKCLGYIPPEMWLYDPWLIEARKAQLAGDKGEFQKYLFKFFELHKAFKVDERKRQWTGADLK